MIDRDIVRDHRRGRSSSVAKYPEVRKLVDDLLPHCTFSEIEAECRKRLRPERVPSRSAIGRYWKNY